MIVGTPGPTVGVEEEFLLVDAGTGDVRYDVADVVAAALREAEGPTDLGPELRQGMVESGSHVCPDVESLCDDLVRLRRLLGQAAGDAGAALVASGTHPTAPPGSTPVTPGERYSRLDADYGITARAQLVCGTHVHVGVASRDDAVAAMDRVRPWAPVLLALGANSPWWGGADSGYSSYRSRVWARWPSAGPSGPFGDAAGFDAVGDALVATGAVLDRRMLYFDVRPSDTYPTLEWRVADVCLDVADAVLLAALARALTTTALTQPERLGPADVRVELVRAATWRAARSGTGGDLVDPRTLRPAPAAQVVARLVETVRDALQDTGDTGVVDEGVARVFGTGGGAARQRAAGSAAAALELAAAVTVP